MNPYATLCTWNQKTCSIFFNKGIWWIVFSVLFTINKTHLWNKRFGLLIFCHQCFCWVCFIESRTFFTLIFWLENKQNLYLSKRESYSSFWQWLNYSTPPNFCSNSFMRKLTASRYLSQWFYLDCSKQLWHLE